MLDPGILNRRRGLFTDQLAGRHDQPGVAVLVELVGIHDIFGGNTANDPLTERLDDVLTLLEGGRFEAENRAAILFGDRDVLGHIDQAPGQVTSVGRLQARCPRVPSGRRGSR